jgi:hypothetical protein
LHGVFILRHATLSRTLSRSFCGYNPDFRAEKESTTQPQQQKSGLLRD